MHVKEILGEIEDYINGDSDFFDVSSVEQDLAGAPKYYINLIVRLIKYYDDYRDNKAEISGYLSSLRCFLLSFQTDIQLKDNEWITDNKFGLKLNPDGRVYASLECPKYLNGKFVSEAFQIMKHEIMSTSSRYFLETNEYIKDLTGINSFYSEAQKLCVMGALYLPGGYSALTVLPTGGGKSLITQTLAYKEKGLTLVIVPTISLAIDQEISAKSVLNRVTSHEIFSYSSGANNGEMIIEAIKNETAKLLFISPEALIKNVDFANAISEANKRHYLKNLVIDEAHIVVEWGDFFRTDYQALEPWRKQLVRDNPEIRTLLLSATVDNNTGMLLKKLFSEDEKWVEFRCDSLRKEPRYCTIKSNSLREKKSRLLEMVNLLPHPLIVYTLKPDRAEVIKEWIKNSGYTKVESFTGDTGTKDRDNLIRAWKNNEFDIMVATSAFGMGVDKPDVRTVIHDFVPDNPSLFYQELGRGGRDGLPCLSVMSIYPELDFETNARGKVLTAETALGRWISMYQSLKSERVEEYVYIDTKIKPTYNLNYVHDEATSRDIQWNIYLLLLLRRYNLIEILDMKYKRLEEKYVFKIKVIDNRLSIANGDTEKLLEEIRTKEKLRFIKEFSSIKRWIVNSDKICITEMLLKTYPYVLEYCAGCDCHDELAKEEDSRFPLVKRVDYLPKKDDYHIANENESLIVTDAKEQCIGKLISNGVSFFVSDSNLDLANFQPVPQIMIVNFYEFRRILAEKQFYYINGVCCIIYSDERERFLKEISSMIRCIGGKIKTIHVVKYDYEINNDGKKVSAVIGNNITDRIMEDTNV